MGLNVRGWWRGLSMQVRFVLLIQGSLIIVLLFTQQWIIAGFDREVMTAAKGRALETADGVINGMNMLMLTGNISDPAKRRLFIKKMADEKGIKSLRIIRAEQVDRQYGPGLPEEQPRDWIEKSVLKTGKTFTQASGSSLRVVVPFLVSKDFRGTNCLSCHHVEVGSVNGAANILLDLSGAQQRIRQINNLIWLGQLALQLLLFVIIWYLVRAFVHPIKSMTNGLNRIAEGDIAKGSHLPVRFHDELGQATQAFNRVMDVAQELINAQLLARTVFDNSLEGIIICDREGHVQMANRAFTQITGFKNEEAVGKAPGTVLKSGKQSDEFYKAFWDSLQQKGEWQGELWDKRKDGELYPEWLTIKAVYDERGEITNYVAVFSDISERKRNEDKIRQLAFYDALTQLPNRRLLHERMQQKMADGERNGRYGAMMFLDLDNFKPLNDAHGHKVGDLLLIEVAQRLTACVRESDTVARFGGDEFVVMLGELDTDRVTSLKQAGIVAEKIRMILGKPYFLNYKQEGKKEIAVEHHCSSSIGVVLFYGHDAGEEDVLKRADLAMYRAKETGRNTVCFEE